MQKVSLIAMLALSLSSFTVANAADSKLPFIGEKSFKFGGGASDEETITIKKDGTTVVRFVGKEGSIVTYRGKYRNPIPMEHGKYYYSIVGNQIVKLDKNKKIADDCYLVYKSSTECKSDLD